MRLAAETIDQTSSRSRKPRHWSAHATTASTGGRLHRTQQRRHGEDPGQPILAVSVEPSGAPSPRPVQSRPSPDGREALWETA